ncbi:hypothetical protein KM043_015216 [Ampulex compressa]|nr:hypothetical protein KM043_015216 [Ampulex compressa]
MLISTYLNDINELDYRCLNIVNDDAVLLLVNQLCGIVLPAETALIQNTCKLLTNLIQNNVKICGPTLTKCKCWILEGLEFSTLAAQNDILLALKSFLMAAEFNDINQYLPSLLGNRALLKRYLDPVSIQWSELNYNAVGSLESIIVIKQNGIFIPQEYLNIIKDIVCSVISSYSYPNDDKPYMSKILSSCLHILHLMLLEKMIPSSTDLTGEILGIVQVFLFYGITNYPPIKPQLLRPAAMNLPERIHTVPKCKNLKNQKAKSRKLPLKKTKAESKHVPLESKGICKYSSDSDASDSESNSLIYADSKVRMEAIQLLQVLVEISQSREIFGYWPQIVATGSRNDARVLTRSLLKEPVCKVKQNVLSTLTEMLIGAKPFLMHAEDVQQTSFVTFFSTVCLMVKELHFTLSLILRPERNIVVQTHVFKCLAALIQGTPYARLKPGLLTKLMRDCRLYLFHKSPTVQVAALSTFEALASCDPITPEILAILATNSINGIERVYTSVSSVSNVGTEEEEEVEVDAEDINSKSADKRNERKIINNTNSSLLLNICLNNIFYISKNTPVRLQSLKVIGRMAFNTGSLIFPHLEKVAKRLASVLFLTDVQVTQHACRTLEIIAGCLTNCDADQNNNTLFWDIIFEPMMEVTQSPHTILREAAYDCLGSIGSNIFTQFTRERTISLITVLLSAVRDEESAVRAAGLRALGMLVTFSSAEKETGFLMDLADVIYSTANDKNLGVRVKGAWALANLCDCLLRRKTQDDSEPLPLDVLLPKLYQVSIQASKDSDKVKCNAVRALGTILHLCPERHILHDISLGLDTLITCAILGNDMKVRWNACRAIGLILSCNPDNVLPPLWKDQVFPALCSLICDSPNFKVRTNAAWALYSCNSYDKYIAMLWKTIALAFENSQHVPSYVEYPHRDALVQQLCLTLSHVAACTEVSELQSVWAEIGNHVQDISNYMKQFQETIVPEKLDDLIKAKSQLQQYVKNAPTSEERKIAQTLASIFERTNRYDNLDIAIRTIV